MTLARVQRNLQAGAAVVGAMRFDLVDVFAPRLYAGNQLAVIRDAHDLGPAEMLSLARETNFSETTFVVDDAPSPSVRIFTPREEIPFAGHPTLGTAAVLLGDRREITLRLEVGPIRVWREGGEVWMRQNAPSFGPRHDPALVARMLGLKESDLAGPAETVSTGLPHVVVPVASLDALRGVRLDLAAYEAFIGATDAKCLFPFAVGAGPGAHLTARQFAPYYGIVEDPATGSGNGCLAAYASKHAVLGSARVDATVEQGAQVGRPSAIRIRAEGARVEVGGLVQHVASGHLVRRPIPG